MNKSKTYILPLLEDNIIFPYQALKFLWDTYVFSDISQGSNPAIIYLEMSSKLKDLSTFEQLHDKLQSNPLFIKYFERGIFLYYVFKIPDNFMPDYYLLLEGKYSKISELAKDKIRSHLYRYYPHKKEKIDLVWKILTKDVSLKIEIEDELNTILPEDVELCDKFNIQKETLLL